ncbi:hypothetical protein [Humibacillus xanthopallidus]|uniref:Uncharacterized protein n=1 Tax=Humibacillus xanthopallidus TaxID=412689 RepID=A0A543HZK1_9MICO|nr:hypothetical protein [Humibacillus xanthopallidus]TQM63710.1 hypothetical protein FBY41_0054 [Humibacillus xanthopallidus]
MIRTRLATALVAAALALIAVAVPAHATPAQGTVSFSGDPGDYITQGQSYSYTAPNDRIDLQGSASHVRVGIEGANGDWWTIELDAPDGEALLAGRTYSATRYPFNDVGAGLDLGGNGRGCNTLIGTFTIEELTLTADGLPSTVRATFEQHCDETTAAARGQIDVSLAPPAPPLQLAVVNTSADLDPYGGLVLRGTVTCSSDAMVYVTTVASQTIRKTTVEGSSGVYVDCWSGRSYSWDLPVYAGGLDVFRAGAVSVSTRATARDSWTQQDVTAVDADSFRLKRV